MAKATHTGTCQVCGAEQKLPGGTLSLHGYTVRWGFFSGTCRGAGHLPFELSKDLIESAIANAQAIAAGLRQGADALDADTTPAAVWVHEYRPATWENRTSAHVWRLIPLAELDVRTYGTERTYYELRYVNSATKRTERVGDMEASVNEAAHKANTRRATAMRREAADADQYVTWQQGRIADWQPQALKAIA